MPLIVIPWAAGCAYRERALRHVMGGLRWPTVLAPHEGRWVKALAVMPAVERAAEGEIVVVHDADVVCDLGAAVRAVETGAPWAMPHRAVHRLSAEGTAAVYAGEPWRDQTFDQRPYMGVEGGGVVVARRETLLDVPLDPRFVGWGQEDESWGLALCTLAGRPWCGKEPLVHLYHPPQTRLTRSRGSSESWELRRRYFVARDKPDQMAQLVNEAQHALRSAQHPVHGDPQLAGDHRR